LAEQKQRLFQCGEIPNIEIGVSGALDTTTKQTVTWTTLLLLVKDLEKNYDTIVTDGDELSLAYSLQPVAEALRCVPTEAGQTSTRAGFGREGIGTNKFKDTAPGGKYSRLYQLLLCSALATLKVGIGNKSNNESTTTAEPLTLMVCELVFGYYQSMNAVFYNVFNGGGALDSNYVTKHGPTYNPGEKASATSKRAQKKLFENGMQGFHTAVGKQLKKVQLIDGTNNQLKHDWDGQYDRASKLLLFVLSIHLFLTQRFFFHLLFSFSVV